jgi:hypothetical protein
LSNLEVTYIDQLKALYQIENFKFEFLISWLILNHRL